MTELQHVECASGHPVNRCFGFINLFGMVADGDQLRFRAEIDSENSGQMILSIDETDIKFTVPQEVLCAMTGYHLTVGRTLGQYLSDLARATAFDREGSMCLAHHLMFERPILVEEVWPQLQNLFAEDDGLVAKALLGEFLAPETSDDAIQYCFSALQNLALPEAARYFETRSGRSSDRYSFLFIQGVAIRIGKALTDAPQNAPMWAAYCGTFDQAWTDVKEWFTLHDQPAARSHLEAFLSDDTGDAERVAGFYAMRKLAIFPSYFRFEGGRGSITLFVGSVVSRTVGKPRDDITDALIDPSALCSGLIPPDTHLGENARHKEVSDDQTRAIVESGVRGALGSMRRRWRFS
ncbi:hypothetical protein PSP31121_05340 [Pandoraea sputorum]|uniref:Uncharacterized protein n=2 Tax=Pandoraea sputorum TaxID=93222 RepID=A0A5E5BMW7_9BURK|nr:hypothetical protein PSP31121_05340 [Pandoraea sputorum]